LWADEEQPSWRFDYKRKPDGSMAVGKADERSEVEFYKNETNPPTSTIN